MSLARTFLRMVGRRDPADPEVQLKSILRRREEIAALSDAELRQLAKSNDVGESFAIAAIVAERLLGLRLFDVQIRGALALQQGHIAEMQTGEGKTLAAVPAIVWYASHHRGMHVLTANDYLARRDAGWMRPVYEWFGLTVAHVSQSMTAEARREAYDADITYATANEIGFDYLRDGLAQHLNQIVQHRGLAFALFDEADSILLDEARIPLVIAAEGGASATPSLAHQANTVAASMQQHIHYRIDEHGRNVQLTDAGIAHAEEALQCGSLFDAGNLSILTAMQDALHAHALLKCDVDYVVHHGSIELVDEFKGRIAQNRRMPAGLHSAIEAKERVDLKRQGRVFGSITVQALAALYERICGMTGTAATQAQDFWKEYKLPVSVIAPHKPVIRQDLPDLLFRTRRDRDDALLEEIRKTHAVGRPILVGTASVEESEALSRKLAMIAVPHVVLNARSDETEAEIITRAGAFGAVTISTNMAGRGADIPLGGDAVIALGGLYVIGTSKHEARRIDAQLRGRAGRQGDPGSSRFFVSLEDGLFTRYVPEEGAWREPVDVDHVQRIAEGQNFELRQLLWKYESVLEHHRREVWQLRRKILADGEWNIASLLSAELYEQWCEKVGAEALKAAGRTVALALLDDLWADYLANIAELRGGVHWVSFGGKDPLHEFLTNAQEIYAAFCGGLEEECEDAFAAATFDHGQIQFQGEVLEAFERGATWTYLTTDQPFGTLGERIAKGIRRKLQGR